MSHWTTHYLGLKVMIIFIMDLSANYFYDDSINHVFTKTSENCEKS